MIGAPDDRMQPCINECLSCHSACVETTAHCLQTGGQHAEEEHIRMLLDCAEICQTSANFMMRGSEHSGLLCRVCLEVCRACAKDCERLGNDRQMMRCAEACTQCIETCSALCDGAARSG